VRTVQKVHGHQGAQTFFVVDDMKAMYRLDGIITVVDAVHVELHLDEEKLEGAQNESVDQLTFVAGSS